MKAPAEGEPWTYWWIVKWTGPQPLASIWVWSWDPLRFVRRHPPHHLSPAEQTTRQGVIPGAPRPVPAGIATLQSRTKASHFWANSRPMGRNPEFRIMGSNPLCSAILTETAYSPREVVGN